MKWVAISGGWRKTNKKIENEVRAVVREIIERGDGIISGGALGVDSIVLDEALRLNPKADRIKIFLPTSLEIYTAHYRQRAQAGVINSEQAEGLITQLTNLKSRNPQALIENPENTIVDKETYFQRNSAVVAAADELVAFHIKTELSEGTGTQDTINKAKQKGLPVKFFSYDLTVQ